MYRRVFLTSALAFSASPLLAASGIAYKNGLVRDELAAGKTVLVDFYTDWCSTCRAQEAVLRELRAENPDYAQSIVFIDIDWDQHRGADITRDLNIPRRSTLVALKGDTEIGRIVAGTSKAQTKTIRTAVNRMFGIVRIIPLPSSLRARSTR